MEMKKLFSDMAQKAAAAADEAREVLSDAGRTVGEKADIAKLSLELSRLKNEQEAVFTKIGRAFYEQQSAAQATEDAPHMETLLAQASEKELLIRELSSRIAQISKKTECPSCHTVCSADAAFCPACGAPLHPADLGE
ncbi:MAG: zinc ribbon domain-containing protein [Pygmaiobacter massiliensis]|nr:zinc ribbon domain-containing protein [Pygmaiobacter massiliensis]